MKMRFIMISSLRFSTLGLFVCLFFSFSLSQQTQAQTLLNPIVVNTFPQTFTNVNTNGGESATGMSGACSAIPCCSTYVYKVTLPSDGALRVEMTNFTPLAGSIIAYRPTVANPATYADLSFISATPGNFCGFRDSLLLGRGFQNWGAVPYGQTPGPSGLTAVFDFNNPSPSVGYFPAGDYYVLVFNENQQSTIGIGLSTNLTFEFAEACAPLTTPASIAFDTIEYNAGIDTVGFYVKNDRQLAVNIDVLTGLVFSGTDASQFSVITAPDTLLAVGDSTFVEVAFAPTSGGAKSASLDISFSDTNCSATSSIALTGFGAQPELKIYGNGISISNNDLSPSVNDFTDMGALVANTGSIQKTFYIVNEGNDTLSLSGSPLVGLTGSSQFVVSSIPAASILPGDSTSFTITFTPTAIGLDTVDLSIVNNDLAQTPFAFRLYGTGAGLNGLDFDGSNDYVNIDAVASSMTGVTSFTIETWIKVDPAQAGNDMIFAVNTSSNGSRMFVKLDDGVMEFDIGTSSDVLAGPDLRDDVWHHIAFVFDNGSLSYYVDGDLSDVETNSVPAFASNDKWSIGQEWDGGGASDFFNGALNELRLWKSVRTATEISGGRFCEIGNPDTNLVAYYTFNQGVPSGSNTSISSLTDWSGNAFNGTLSGFALNGSSSNFILASEVGTNCTSFNADVCDALTYTTPSGAVFSSNGLYQDTIQKVGGGDSVLYINVTIAQSVLSQTILSDTVVCDTLLKIAETNLTPYARFEDSNSDWIETNGTVDSLVNTNRSVFLWMKEADQVSSSQDVLVGINTSGTGTVTNFGIATNEQLWINDGGSNRNSGVIVTDGLWHFVGYTYDEGSNLTQFWVDGVAAASFSNGQSISSTSRISIGQEFDGSSLSNFYDGDMAQLSIWNEVLDSSDIALIMQSAIENTHPKYSKLKAYYPMTSVCSASGFTVEDAGPHGYDGVASASSIVRTDSLVALTGFNAAPLYTKNWSLGSSSVSTANSLSLTGTVQAGTYNLSLKRDYFEINDAFDVTVQAQCSGPAASIAVNSNISCNGLTDGQATASAVGGTSPYTYTWSSSATTASIAGIGAGTYSVTITDANGTTDSASVVLIQPNAIGSSASVTQILDCFNDTDGQVTASASGGTTPYTFSWNTGGTFAQETSLGAGTYSVTITDQNGCTDSTSVTMTQPAMLGSSAAVTSVLDCFSDTDGQVTASASGGTTPYTYSWNTGGTFAQETGLGAGTYSVTITDQNGCTDSTSVTMTQPAMLGSSAAVTSALDCFNDTDGQVTASATGGNTPYTFAWNTGGTFAQETSLGAGTYSITITDQNGCTDSTSVTMTQPATLGSSAAVTSALDCFSDTDGQVTASATGGTTPYTYSWNNGGTSALETGLSAGTYSVTITDQNGCTDSTSVTMTQPATLGSSAAVTSALDCFNDTDGQVTASATGGTTPYTFAWNTGGTAALETGLVAGTYSVTITDQNGCTDSTSTIITQPTALVASSSLDSNITCNSGSDGGATASVTGGTVPYTYSWSNSATTVSITGVVADTYSVTVTDNSGCTDSTSINLAEPDPLNGGTISQ
jgi:hypothetical protein